MYNTLQYGPLYFHRDNGYANAFLSLSQSDFPGVGSYPTSDTIVTMEIA